MTFGKEKTWIPMLLCLAAGVVFGDPCTAEVRTVNGTPRLYIDGEAVVPMAYKTLGKSKGTNYWNSCLETMALARDAGLHIYQLRVQLNLLGLPTRLLRGQTINFDNSEFDEIIAINPDARFIVDLGLTPDPYYRTHNQISQSNPTPAEEDYSGMVWNYNISTGQIEPHTRPSPLSEKTWQDVEASVDEVVAHLEEKYGDRIIMYWPAFSDIGEWYYGIWSGSLVPGFGPCTAAGFQQWATNTYGTVSAMNTAWGSSYAAFDEVPVPTWTQRNSGSAGDFFDPDADRYVIDFFDFFNGTMNVGAERIAAHIKELTGRNKLVGMFWQYLHPLGHTTINRAGLNHSGHLKLMDLLECPDIDVLGTPIYPEVDHRQMPFHGTVDTIQEHGKLFWHEQDMATHLSLHPGRTADIDETLATYAYDFDEWIERQCGFWFFDIVVNGEDFSILNDSNIWNFVAERNRYWEEHCFGEEGAQFRPEIAVIRNERSARFMPSRNPVIPAVYSSDMENTLTQMIRHLVEVRDAPVGWYALEDMLAGRIPDSVNLFIFADTFVVNRSDTFTLLDRLEERPGCMAVWFYAPGYLDPDHLESQNGTGIWFISRLTGGITPNLFPGPVRDRVQPVAHELTVGVPMFGTDRTDLNPQFYIRDNLAHVEPLCVYADDPARIAAALLPAGNGNSWDSVYICPPAINAELLVNLADRAGLHPASGFNDASLPDWAVGAGSWEGSTGLLRQTATASPAFIGLGGRVVSNGSIRADVQLSGSGWAGLSFRKQEPDGSPFESGYLVHVRTNGTITLYKPGGVVAGASSAADPVNGFVRLRVEALDSNIVVYADGRPVISTTDTGSTSGHAGFATDTGTTAQFDRFRVDEVAADMDSDGLPNEWEQQWFASPITAEPGLDPDADRLTNIGEYIAGTDPQNGASCFSAFADGHRVMWNAVTGRTYRVWRTLDLNVPFEVVDDQISFPQNEWEDPVGHVRAFYKLDVELK
jgi:hypothetical protein